MLKRAFEIPMMIFLSCFSSLEGERRKYVSLNDNLWWLEYELPHWDKQMKEKLFVAERFSGRMERKSVIIQP